ncbi:MAG TPA: LamG-like jellyroll fold domain-containing protein, partial [Prosthecobacter sp.]|nr:LamG-like jellyroll fold domain-containing protein [Prosthecobacter sp.]
RYGRFSAHVPPQARGFRIGTPKGEIVDLGTDFGLDLNDAASELHVFKGEVEFYEPKAQMRTLTTGHAMGLGQPMTAKALVANPSAFAFSGDLSERVNESQRFAFENWQKAAAQWNRDANLLLRLDFQDSTGARSLRNTAIHGQHIEAGAIVGCTWTSGRWPGKQALQFRSVSDRVRFNVPGEYQEMTLATWVQLHSLSTRQSQSSICMSQGIEVGGIHWQVLHNGSLCLGVIATARPDVTDDYISPVVFTPERFGQWVHLAVTFDNAGREVRHYVNGELLSRHPVKRPLPLRPGLAELGNWLPSTNYRAGHPVRNFVGCMDDFSLCTRALSDDEVRTLAK